MDTNDLLNLINSVLNLTVSDNLNITNNYNYNYETAQSWPLTWSSSSSSSCTSLEEWLDSSTNFQQWTLLFAVCLFVDAPLALVDALLIKLTVVDLRCRTLDSSASPRQPGLSWPFLAGKIGADFALLISFMLICSVLLRAIGQMSDEFYCSVDCACLNASQAMLAIERRFQPVAATLRLSQVPFRLAGSLSVTLGLLIQLQKYLYFTRPLHYGRLVGSSAWARACALASLTPSAALLVLDWALGRRLYVQLAYAGVDLVFCLLAAALNVAVWRNVKSLAKSETELFYFVFGWIATNLALLTLVDVLAALIEVLPADHEHIRVSWFVFHAQIVLLQMYCLFSVVSLLIKYPEYWRALHGYWRSCRAFVRSRTTTPTSVVCETIELL